MNFLGLKDPPAGRSIRAAVVGKKGKFLDAVLAASVQVELYDEELESEPYRRGVRTEKITPATLAKRLAALASGEVFPCLLGFDALPAGSMTAGQAVVFAPSANRWPGAALLVGYRSAVPPRREEPAVKVLSARRIAAGRGEAKLALPTSPPLMLVIDPFVMDPSLFPVRRNVEPGGLAWYQLTGLMRSVFSTGRVKSALVLPAPLPSADPVPAFVLARLTAKILAYALHLR